MGKLKPCPNDGREPAPSLSANRGPRRPRTQGGRRPLRRALAGFAAHGGSGEPGRGRGAASPRGLRAPRPRPRGCHRALLSLRHRVTRRLGHSSQGRAHARSRGSRRPSASAAPGAGRRTPARRAGAAGLRRRHPRHALAELPRRLRPGRARRDDHVRDQRAPGHPPGTVASRLRRARALFEAQAFELKAQLDQGRDP